MPVPTVLCVYCGSSSGDKPEYAALARDFGQALAQRGIALVYGGGNVGLMGVLADAVLGADGTVIGVIPQQLVEKEVAHSGLTEMHVVQNMHERKTRMYELSQAFVALPGGFGTLDEMFEMLTWAQLGLHQYPCAFLDVHGYYRHLQHAMQHMVGERFVRHSQLDGIWFGQEIDALFAWMAQYQPDYAPKWIDTSAVTSS